MERLQRLAHRLDRINEMTGRAVSWLTLLMVLVTVLIVLLRYLFNLGWIAMQETVTYLHALVFMLGAAYTLKHDGHVRVDVFYCRFGARGQAWVDLAGSLLLLGPVALFILWVSWAYVAESWHVLEGSGETGGLPAVFLLKSAIPVFSLLLLLQGAAQAIRSVLVLKGDTAAAPQHDARGEI